MIKKYIIALSAASALLFAASANAAPTSTIVTNLFITGLAGNGTECLHILNSGLVQTTSGDCGSGSGSGGGVLAGAGITSTISGSTTTLTLNLSGTGCVGNNFLQAITATGTGTCATPSGGASSTNVFGVNGVTVSQLGVNATASLDTTYAALWTALETFKNGLFANGSTTLASTTNCSILNTNVSGTIGCNNNSYLTSAITSINGNTTAAQTFTAGTGISITSAGGNTTSTNTGVTSLTGANCVTSANSTGTITLTVTCISANQSITWTGTGDATGTGNGTVSITVPMHVVAIQGRAVSSTAPTDQQYLKFVTANSDWEPATLPGYITTSTFNLTGTAWNITGWNNAGTSLLPTSTIYMQSSTGNIGIFTTNPASRLTVAQSSTGDEAEGILIDGSLNGATSNADLELNAASSSATEANVDFTKGGVDQWQIGIQNNGTNDFELWDGANNPAFTCNHTSLDCAFGTSTASGEITIQNEVGSNSPTLNALSSSGVNQLVVSATGTVTVGAGTTNNFLVSSSTNKTYVEAGTSPVAATVGGTLAYSATSTGGSAGVSTTLETYTMPTSTLLTVGDEIDIYTGGTIANTAGSKQIQIAIASTTIFDSSGGSGVIPINTAGNWFAESRCVLFQTTSTRCITQFTDSANSALTDDSGDAGNTLAAVTTTIPIVFNVYGLGTAGSDVVGNYFRVMYDPF